MSLAIASSDYRRAAAGGAPAATACGAHIRVAQASYHGAATRPGQGTLESVPTIAVLDDDASTRDALAGMLRDLFPRARVIGARVDDARVFAERDGVTLVLTGLAAVARVRPRLPVGARVVALTREMGPDTLVRAEALGVAASMRAPATPGTLQAVLEPMLGRDGARDPD
jgi:hypothetical protein